MKRIWILLLFTLISASISAQDCEGLSESDWKGVEVKIMENTDPPKGLKVSGEWFLKSKKRFRSVDDLSKGQLKEIKKRAIKYGSCLVYIDTKGLFGVRKGLYYYYVKKIK